MRMLASNDARERQDRFGVVCAVCGPPPKRTRSARRRTRSPRRRGCAKKMERGACGALDKPPARAPTRARSRAPKAPRSIFHRARRTQTANAPAPGRRETANGERLPARGRNNDTKRARRSRRCTPKSCTPSRGVGLKSARGRIRTSDERPAGRSSSFEPAHASIAPPSGGAKRAWPDSNRRRTD